MTSTRNYRVSFKELCEFEAYIKASNKAEAIEIAQQRLAESAQDSFKCIDCDYDHWKAERT